MPRVRAIVVAALVCLAASGCQSQIGDPLPGSFHLTSEPELAPYSITIRIDGIGGPSGRTAEFESGDEVVIDWSTLPLPQEKWIEVNGQDCVGTFTIEERVVTVLRMTILESGCRVDVLGSHPEPT